MNWDNLSSLCSLKAALEDAEDVLYQDPEFVKAIFGKAESLFNICHFEHALLFYCRGQVGCFTMTWIN